MNSAAARSKRSRSAGGWLRGRNRRKQRRRPDAHAADWIGEQRRSKRPKLIGRHAFEHVEGADAHHRIGVRKARSAPSRRSSATGVGASSVSALARANAGAVAIGGDCGKQRRRIRSIGPRGMERLGISSGSPSGSARASSRPPLPPMRAICQLWQSLQALGVPSFADKIGPRNAETVIVPPIDHHVGARRHVTGRAAERRIRRLMVVMRGRRVFVGRVALQADAVAGQRAAWRCAARGNRCRSRRPRTSCSA